MGKQRCRGITVSNNESVLCESLGLAVKWKALGGCHTHARTYTSYKHAHTHASVRVAAASAAVWPHWILYQAVGDSSLFSRDVETQTQSSISPPYPHPTLPTSMLAALRSEGPVRRARALLLGTPQSILPLQVRARIVHRWTHVIRAFRRIFQIWKQTGAKDAAPLKIWLIRISCCFLAECSIK